jgi:hypothetical protein
MPLLVLCYVVAFIDRSNVGFAKLQFLKDLGFNEAVYGLGGGMFYLGYVLFEIPSNLYLVKAGVTKTLLRIMHSARSFGEEDPVASISGIQTAICSNLPHPASGVWIGNRRSPVQAAANAPEVARVHDEHRSEPIGLMRAIGRSPTAAQFLIALLVNSSICYPRRQKAQLPTKRTPPITPWHMSRMFSKVLRFLDSSRGESIHSEIRSIAIRYRKCSYERTDPA